MRYSRFCLSLFEGAPPEAGGPRVGGRGGAMRAPRRCMARGQVRDMVPVGAVAGARTGAVQIEIHLEHALTQLIFALLFDKRKGLPDSIMVVRQILVLFVEVRILVGQLTFNPLQNKGFLI